VRYEERGHVSTHLGVIFSLFMLFTIICYVLSRLDHLRSHRVYDVCRIKINKICFSIGVKSHGIKILF
jgi:hypothetical protein